MNAIVLRCTALTVVSAVLFPQMCVASAGQAPPRRPAAVSVPPPPSLPHTRVTPPPMVQPRRLRPLAGVSRDHEGGGTLGHPPINVVVHDPKHAPADPHALGQRRSVREADRIMPVPVTPGRHVPGVAGTPPGGRRRSSVMGGSGCNATPSDNPSLTLADRGTGVKPWWSFAQGTVPGMGSYFVNVANQNLVVQADDMYVRNAGVDLAFRRTFNSFSQHDANASDGATPSELGNGWTSTFDAHLSGNSAGGLTVSDVDGARYDYVPDGQGHWVPPTGQHATLTSSDGGFSYQWTKKTGTSFIFAGPSFNQSNTYSGYNGRLLKISGRNSNTYINFTYWWQCNNGASNENLAEVDATTQAGLTAKLYFANFAGHTLLSRLVWPDGVTTVWYNYDAAGNLYYVQKPAPNNSGQLTTEVYDSNPNVLILEGPRFSANINDGGYIAVLWAADRSVLGV